MRKRFFGPVAASVLFALAAAPAQGGSPMGGAVADEKAPEDCQPKLTQAYQTSFKNLRNEISRHASNVRIPWGKYLESVMPGIARESADLRKDLDKLSSPADSEEVYTLPAHYKAKTYPLKDVLFILELDVDSILGHNGTMTSCRTFNLLARNMRYLTRIATDYREELGLDPSHNGALHKARAVLGQLYDFGAGNRWQHPYR